MMFSGDKIAPLLLDVDDGICVKSGWEVWKFGGSSLLDYSRLCNAADLMIKRLTEWSSGDIDTLKNPNLALKIPPTKCWKKPSITEKAPPQVTSPNIINGPNNDLKRGSQVKTARELWETRIRTNECRITSDNAYPRGCTLYDGTFKMRTNRMDGTPVAIRKNVFIKQLQMDELEKFSNSPSSRAQTHREHGSGNAYAPRSFQLPVTARNAVDDCRGHAVSCSSFPLNNHQLAVVASAMGGVTNNLVEALRLAETVLFAESEIMDPNADPGKRNDSISARSRFLSEAQDQLNRAGFPQSNIFRNFSHSHVFGPPLISIIVRHLRAAQLINAMTPKKGDRVNDERRNHSSDACSMENTGFSALDVLTYRSRLLEGVLDILVSLQSTALVGRASANVTAHILGFGEIWAVGLLTMILNRKLEAHGLFHVCLREVNARNILTVHSPLDTMTLPIECEQRQSRVIKRDSYSESKDAVESLVEPKYTFAGAALDGSCIDLTKIHSSSDASSSEDDEFGSGNWLPKRRRRPVDSFGESTDTNDSSDCENYILQRMNKKHKAEKRETRWRKEEGVCESNDKARTHAESFFPRLQDFHFPMTYPIAGANTACLLAGGAGGASPMQLPNVDYRVSYQRLVKWFEAYGAMTAQEAERLKTWKRRTNDTNSVIYLLVITGFISRSRDGLPETLQRNGSDVTAAVFTALLRSRICVIWSDVEGIYSADPKKIKTAELLPLVSYEEALELACFGARVLHPATLLPCIHTGTPLLMKSSLNPTHPGTIVTAGENVESLRKGSVGMMVTVASNICILTLLGFPLHFLSSFASRLCLAIEKGKGHPLLISQASSRAAITVAVVAERTEEVVVSVVETFRHEARRIGHLRLAVDTSCSIVSVVGLNMAGVPGALGLCCGALGEANVNIKTISQSSNETSFSFVVSCDQQDVALEALHNVILDFGRERIDSTSN